MDVDVDGDVAGPLSDLDEDEQRWLRERLAAGRAEDARPERAELDDRLDHLPFTLREASRSVDQLLAHLLRRADVTDLPLAAVHLVVLARTPRPVVALAGRLRVSAQAAGRMVSVLEGRGLVTRTVDPTDRRQRLVGTTEKGEALLRQVRGQLFVAVSLVADDLGDERLVTLVGELADLAMIEPDRAPW
ncbi:MarR family transcriptional regulator [Phycicoccus sp. M110.8]|uniref:MarR family winged helix-turn-helix transcriptional regulator n=1 Tax=Phycicoccus sp. M110.8 TaxID=3075433 RepID=UPI0028FD9CB4|nr:MarR family transcriptional regulator [Phycicoccus sp. M110.8]MDU0314818.1 MarR family transcriptional regulator [Phycicoccus sp. M110.8]